ncbi:hypothetical protein QE152_g32710 [Popillia japonica]|uniref:Uncharacterized protein n=1 Tax=Popillia japonica TaxID=7064 RepID=A0AAW1IYQ0_POPJA
MRKILPLYGRSFVGGRDHKLLLGLIRKSLDSLSPRLQCLVIRLMKYDVTLQYTPGKQLYIPNTLSRAPLESEKAAEFLDDFFISSIILVSDNKCADLRNNINSDSELQII